MNKRSLVITLIFSLSLALAACTGSVVKFDGIQDKPFDATRGREVKASACGFQFYLFFPIMINDRGQRAYAELVRRANGDVLTDVKVNERWIYALLGTAYCTDLIATAYPALGPATTASTPAITPVSTTVTEPAPSGTK